MPSSKGKPTDPKLREHVKEKVKNETNKDGSGKGQWSAWKASKLSKEYEAKGGDYEDETGSKNKPKKGTPEPKGESKKKSEPKSPSKHQSDEKGQEKVTTEAKNGTKQQEDAEDANRDANGGKGTNGANSAKKRGRPAKGSESKNGAREKPAPRVGTRRSSRVAEKREVEDGGSNGGSAKKSKKE